MPVLSGLLKNCNDQPIYVLQHEAVNHGNAAIAELLIKHGASVNAPALHNETPLHDAVSSNHLECVKVLVVNGANVLARYFEEKNVFYACCDYQPWST